MKSSAQIAYEGLLTALSVVLLWLAAAVPAIGFGGCICAGVLPAVMLSKRKVRAGAIIYTSTMVLAFILLPNKRYAVAYALFFGIYPFIKYVMRYDRFHKVNGKLAFDPKEREICYSAHIDRCIYQYYSALLNEKYNLRLKHDGINNVPVAYRTDLHCNNIDIFRQAIDFIRECQSC